MAITRTTISKNVGWTKSDVIGQLEEAFAWLGKHGGALSGVVGGIGYPTSPTNIGGILTPAQTVVYRDVEPSSTSGSGTGASFDVYRYSSGKVTAILPNRGGKGYADGDTVTLPASKIGGSTNGATNIVVPVFVDGTNTGGNTYTFTYTGYFVLSGTDINGSVSNVSPTTDYSITIREGDTLQMYNSHTNGYPFYVYFTDVDINEGLQMCSFSGIAINAISGSYTSQPSSTALTWTPRPGQAGTYHIIGYSTSSASFLHKIVVLPNDGSKVFAAKSYGTSSTFWSKQASGSSSVYPWGCMRHVVQSNKKYGDTYRLFQMVSQNTLSMAVGSYFRPVGGSPNVYESRFKGSANLDISYYENTSTSVLFTDTQANTSFVLASSYLGLPDICDANAGNAYSLDLNIFRSSIDPKFAVLSFKQPNLSSTSLSSNTGLTFIVHDFITDIWDLNYVFLSGITAIIGDPGNSTSPRLTFRTWGRGGTAGNSNAYPSLRAAEAGYEPMGSGSTGSSWYSLNTSPRESVYMATSYPHTSSTYQRSQTMYYRTNDATEPNTRNRGIGMPDESNFNAIISGIPLNSTYVPVPYYLPDDFVLVQFENASPSLNVQQGDTLVVQSGVEEYVVIQGSYNQTVKTRGILFCARIV